MYLSASCSIMINDCELIMTWLLVLEKDDLKSIDMMYWSLEHVTSMCEQSQGNILGISLTHWQLICLDN